MHRRRSPDAEILVQAIAMLALGSCGAQTETYAQYGAMLARDPTIARTTYNAFTCLTCHAERASDVGSRIYPGAVLEGVTNRPNWWGGNVVDLQVAVADCYQHFMQGPTLDPNGDLAQALLAYLTDLSTTAPAAQNTAVAFTVQDPICDLLPGDVTNGATVYANACATCHGALDAGPVLGEAVLIPMATLTAHMGIDTPPCIRDVFIEKIRNGSFLGYAGQMPPFSLETMTNTQVADVLAYLSATPTGTCAGTNACTP